MPSEIKQTGDFLKDYPPDWPPKEYFVSQHSVTKAQLEELASLVQTSAPEKEIDKFFQENPAVLACCLTFVSTGHHGAWVISQQVVCPPQGVVKYGLKSDYIIAGKDSEGFHWYVIELKGANELIFSESDGRVHFSKAANRGVFQLLEYIDYCAEAQSYLRDSLRLTDFREPRGILLIGRESELENSPKREKAKAAWNRVTRGALEVRTYDALLRFVEGGVSFHGKLGTSV